MNITEVNNPYNRMSPEMEILQRERQQDVLSHDRSVQDSGYNTYRNSKSPQKVMYEQPPTFLHA